MKKYLISLFILLSCSIFSLEVNRDFIEIDLDLTVEFDNYVGPYLFYNSVEEIRNIGRSLAVEITPNIKSDADYSGKYLMAHRPKIEWEQNKNSCDILQITSSALIDNVNNIELILSQYLIENYGYTLDDGNLLAHLLVIYNAVNRGNVEHISSFYTSESVLTNDPTFLGLDLQYQNWPGQTYIYIPLSDKISLGKLTNINSDLLVTPTVINSIKLKDDKDIELREDIIDFKEREFDEISIDIENSEIKIKELKIINENKEDVIIKKEIEVVEEEIISSKEELKEKETNILELRDDLAEDKNKLIINDNQNISLPEFPYIVNRVVKSEIHGQLVHINIDGNVIKRGSVNSIRNNSYVTSGDYIYVIAGGDGENQLVTLGQIAKKSLSLLSWADIPCFESSPIIVNENKIYTIVQYDNDYYIGEFNQSLKLIRISPVNLIKESYLLFKNGIFYIQGKYNSIELVNLSDFIVVSE